MKCLRSGVGQKGKSLIPHNCKSDLNHQTETRDFEEWELKLRRDQLEAELKVYLCRYSGVFWKT